MTLRVSMLHRLLLCDAKLSGHPSRHGSTFRFCILEPHFPNPGKCTPTAMRILTLNRFVSTCRQANSGCSACGTWRLCTHRIRWRSALAWSGQMLSLRPSSQASAHGLLRTHFPVLGTDLMRAHRHRVRISARRRVQQWHYEPCHA